MLNLTFKDGESVMIGDNMRVYVENIHEGRARLRFDCDTTVPIWRREIWEKIHMDKLAEAGVIDNQG